ncbi:MAG: late competence development ComFB family protein [Lachnospiraceae bacterium]|nr:late competence development ComFB family protein [Lachnospiraceae bacterium]
MAKKTNKTEHVLSLISKAKETNITEDDDDVEIQTIESKVTPDLSFVDLQLAHDTELSEKIKENLTQESEPALSKPHNQQSAFEKVVMDAAKSVVEEENPSEDNENLSAAMEEPGIEQESYVIQSKNKDIQVEPLPDLDALEEVETLPSPSTPASTQTVESVNKQDTKEVEQDRYIYVNVLEEIVKERVETYMRKFGVCTCPRCVADTIALALNGLTPKYVVIDKKAGSPMFNYLENQYAGVVTTQLSQACITVKNNPYH